MKKMKKLNLLLGTLLATAALSHAVDSYSDVVGYYKKAFPAGGSLQSVSLLKPVTFRGVSTGISSKVLNCASATWSAGAFAPVNGLPAFYVEITSGPLEGYLFDVVSNTGTSVTVGDASIANAGSSPSFLIRAHTKLSDALRNATNLNDYADQVTVYNADGSVVSFLRDSSTTTGWVDATSFSESDAVIYPCTGYVLTTSSPGDYTVTGTLKSTKTVVPLMAGLVNIVALANPGGASKNIQNINLGANLADYADQVATYVNDGTLGTSNALLYGGAADGFLDATSFSPVTGVNVGGNESVIVSVSSSTVWKLNAPLSQ